MESKDPLLLDMDNMMCEEENVIDPKSATVQFGAVLREMQSVFCRKEGSIVKEQEFVTDLKSEMNDDFVGFLTTPPSWCLERHSDVSEVSIDETLDIPMGEDVGATYICEEEQILKEVLDEETGYHSMTTTSSDSSSLDSLSPSPTSSVGIVRALNSTPPPSKRTFLQLPDKILVNNLLALLGTQDLVRLSASCRRLQRLCW